MPKTSKSAPDETDLWEAEMWALLREAEEIGDEIRGVWKPTDEELLLALIASKKRVN